VWHNRKGAPEIPSPLIVDDLVFMVNEGGVVSCVEAKNGNPVWKGRIGGNHWASPLYAGGNIYFFSMDGTGICYFCGSSVPIAHTQRV